jgi:hypothetical protein
MAHSADWLDTTIVVSQLEQDEYLLYIHNLAMMVYDEGPFSR